ncbi:hypothetical protein QBC47DRAFT_383941 [Echria macrotheca]|uniref:Uncharacterized protein n=1 Tax=Echria macrotheca TaxID=438768 RepID=A0AAJ0BA09_9PEZI|nr:hypothetical protein QBC47DRAFT_383941 [Echria macrotheca]
MRAIQESVLYELPQQLGWQISLSNECCNSPLWDQWYPRLRFAFFVIFLVYYVFGMPAVFWWTRRRNGASGILNCYAYTGAVGLTALGMLLQVIAEGLLNCQKAGSLDYVKVWTAANVFRYMANVIMLYIVILPISDRMLKHAGWTAHPLVGHWIIMAFVSIFALLFVVMWNYNLIHSVTGEETTDPNFGVEATYVTLYLVAALYAAGHLMVSRLKLIRTHGNQQGLVPWCPLLPIGLVGYALMDFIVIFAFYIVPREYTTGASATFVILALFFQALVFVSVPFIATSKALEEVGAERLVDQEQK